MAHDPETVEAFFAELRARADPQEARAEIDVMAALLAAEEGDDACSGGTGGTTTPSCARRSTARPARDRRLLPLSQVLDGLLAITAEVFGLEYRRLDDVPVWHPDVLSYAIVDRATGGRIAVAHMDLHPREGKFSHAAAFDLVPGRRLPDGTYRTPVVVDRRQLHEADGRAPLAAAHDEVVTFFHEFGHILHQTLTRAETVRFSGTNTERDFVEAPSQIMEHWCWRSEVLGRFARHHETG